jgi:exodeoxyribonuclease V gamma subunit
MIHVHRSNRLERLADALAETLAAPTDDPLAPDVVVVHSTGMERWVAMQLAQRHGVCANVAFQFPMDLVEGALAATLGDAPSGWAQERLSWHVAAALPALLDEPAFAPLRAHVSASDHAPDAVVALSSRIAALFERYALERPDLARAWTAEPGDDWQSRLWHAVSASAGPHLPTLADRLAEAMRLRPLPPEIPPRIALFSVGTLPPLVVDVISTISTAREVHLFVLAASDAAWERHRPLASPPIRTAPRPPADPSLPALWVALGRPSRDLQLVVGSADPIPLEAAPRWEDPGSDSMLHVLQSDLLRGRRRSHEAVPVAPEDRSVEVHACHGLFRQVEVLRDVLVRLLDADPTLEPRHVVVMTPDVDRYGPIVEAVFGDGAPDAHRAAEHPSGMPRLPYAVGDKGAAAENPVAAALLAILEVAREGRFEAPAVLDLFSHPPIRQRFAVDPARLPDLHRWARDAGIRWGRDAQHRAEWRQPERPRFTWRFGLDRLLVGQAVLDDDSIPRDKGGPLVPVPLVEGRDARAALGGLADLADALFELSREVAAPRAMSGWAELVLRALERFVAVPDRQAGLVRVVRETVERLRENAAAAGHGAPLGLSAVQELLLGRFSVREPGRAFLGGAVTICELVPMRSIPFRVVCLVGMDEGAFPRDVLPASFDLVAAAPRVGDRTAREDDRGLLLETLLAARERLVVTYSAWDLQDGAERPPCVPVAELLDVVEDTFGEGVRRRVVEEHPLQAFGPAAFDAAAPRSPDRRRLDAARAFLRGRVAALPTPRPTDARLDADAPGPVSLADLRKAVRGPCDVFGRRMGLSFWEEKDVPLDREPLLSDGLVAWQIRDDLVRLLLSPRPPDAKALKTRAANDSRVPLGAAGTKAFEEAQKQALALAEEVRRRRNGAPAQHADVDLLVGDRPVHGRVHDVGPDGIVRWSAGKVKAKSLIELWIDLLALAADGRATQAVLVPYREPVVTLRAPPDPFARLAELVSFRDEALTRPLPFLPDHARGWAQGLHSGEDPFVARMRADQGWDPAGVTRLAFPVLPKTDEPERLARLVWMPVIGAER